ncbi:hypothetical protein SMSP2_02059 [Limihaloglobus sulfuriphilus]|uniref:Cadherin-like beta sandwich domain protein n=1 Tax=Limihaloglobus sulfuriphilus TaxID=1851148 RepID=A0A1Q2MHF6_9BACT|nr:hypothetical protein [Limihaloglobus sulfuriphilus]AQQ71682.1 hypothetical protein SMSP2_02059 [Limihaloglobus sulfuriphilus]
MNKMLHFLLAVSIFLSIGVLYAEDPDYGSTYDTAEPITADGTPLQGVLTSGDEDWFTCSAAGVTMYRVTLTNQNSNYKYVKAYQIDEFGDLIEAMYFNAYNNQNSQTMFLQSTYDIYLEVYNSDGVYSISIEAIGTYPEDAHSANCVDATPIVIDDLAVEATITRADPSQGLPLDEDWFVFTPTPLHKYRILLTHSNNANVDFKIYSGDCTTELRGWDTDATIVSWFGEDVKIYVSGDDDKLGEYYTLEVIDMGGYPDDHGNIPEQATGITDDGTQIYGSLDYDADIGEDEDWFAFTPQENCLYNVTLSNSDSNYKFIKIFQEDEFGELIETYYFNSYNKTNTNQLFFEKSGDVYAIVYNNSGGYWISFDQAGIYPPDQYSNDCGSANSIMVDEAPIEATITRGPPLDTDWFVFETQALHHYQVKLTHSANSNVDFKIFSGDCGTELRGWDTDMNFVSWYGDDYKIYVCGDDNRLGEYYTLQVLDINSYTDDYPNTWDQAASIPKDGTMVAGEIEYMGDFGSDEDWFTFVAGQDGDYVFQLENPDSNYKYMKIYREDMPGHLIELLYFNCYNNLAERTQYIEAGTCYIQLYNSMGDYQFSVLSPEPRCGDLDHPYPPGDANKDCVTDILDIAQMATGWLQDNRPAQ